MEHYQTPNTLLSSAHGSLPRKTMFIFVLNCFSCNWLFVTSWTKASQALLSMGFSRQEYWSGLPCPLLGDLPNSGREHTLVKSPALAGRFFTTSASWEAPRFSLGHKTNLNKYSLAVYYKIKLSLNNTVGHSCSLVFIQMSWKLMSTHTKKENLCPHKNLHINEHEFEWAPGVGDGQRSLACYSPWGCKQLDMTEQLNWIDASERSTFSEYFFEKKGSPETFLVVQWLRLYIPNEGGTGLILSQKLRSCMLPSAAQLPTPHQKKKREEVLAL